MSNHTQEQAFCAVFEKLAEEQQEDQRYRTSIPKGMLGGLLGGLGGAALAGELGLRRQWGPVGMLTGFSLGAGLGGTFGAAMGGKRPITAEQLRQRGEEDTPAGKFSIGGASLGGLLGGLGGNALGALAALPSAAAWSKLRGRPVAARPWMKHMSRAGALGGAMYGGWMGGVRPNYDGGAGEEG